MNRKKMQTALAELLRLHFGPTRVVHLNTGESHRRMLLWNRRYDRALARSLRNQPPRSTSRAARSEHATSGRSSGSRRPRSAMADTPPYKRPEFRVVYIEALRGQRNFNVPRDERVEWLKRTRRRDAVKRAWVEQYDSATDTWSRVDV